MSTYVVNAKSAEGFHVDVTARNHHFVVDQPEAAGGNNEGPNPLEYNVASLAACMITIGNIIKKQEHLKVEGMDVKVEADVDPAILMGKAEGHPGFSEVRIFMKVTAPEMTEAEIEDFVNRIEQRCPVSDNLKVVTPVKLIIE
ncbi:MAG: OsmC family protein [Anaerolineae bacterium]|nr:OsmC family protein [Anaerolineae bacterium]